MKCDVCNSDKTYVKEHEHNYKIKDKEINFKASRRFCKNCDALIFDEKLDNEASKLAMNIYNEIYGLSKEKILEFRKKYNISLDLLSKLIGCAKKTLISYEQGNSIPNDTYLISLKMIINNPELVMFYAEANRNNISDKEYLRLSKTFDFKNELSEYNGYTNQSIEKIENSILYFAENSISKTKLLKELFYTDFDYYKNNAASISGLEYIRFKFGPVPKNYEDILENMLIKGLINYEIEFDGNYETHTITAIKPSLIKLFNNKELSTMKKVKDFFKGYTSSKIANFSHQEKAWLETFDGQKISYKYALDLNNLEKNNA